MCAEIGELRHKLFTRPMNKSISDSNSKVNIDATFDTLKLVKVYSKYASIDLSKLKYNRQENCRWHQDGFINIKLFQSRDGYKILIVKCDSLSGLLYGSNVFPASRQDEIDEALCLISNKVLNVISYKFDAFLAKVIAVDANQDFFTHYKNYYLKAVSNHEVSRTEKFSYSANTPLFDEAGVKLFNKSKSLLTYDKHRQLIEKHPELPAHIQDFAFNLFRVEKGSEKHVLRKSIQEFFGDKDRTAGKILVPEFADFLVKKAIKELGLDKDILTFADYEKLVHWTFPKPYIAARIITLMKDVARLGIKKAKRKHKNFAYRKSQLVEVGLWRTYFADKTLPPISRFGNDDESFYIEVEDESMYL